MLQFGQEASAAASSVRWPYLLFFRRRRTSSRDSSIPSSPSSSFSSSRISPSVLFTIVILAPIVFLSGLLHLLVRFLLRKRPSSSSSAPSPADPGTLQCQLQQMFHLHDSGLDQAHIDALPLFSKPRSSAPRTPSTAPSASPSSCQTTSSACGHAFHLACIDTWLLSNSSCTLCRGLILAQGIDDPNADEEEFQRVQEAKERMFSVTLGKFKKSRCEDTGVERTDLGGDKQ